MGYPYGKTYLEQIHESQSDRDSVRIAFYVLRQKYVKDHDGYTSSTDLGIKENFAILGEAFELASDVLDGITDEYHFMWDVMDVLLLGH